MADSLKVFFSPALVRRLAADIAQVEPTFPARAFTRQATAGLADLELLDRGKHIARALRDHLPAAYPDALAILLRSLGPEQEGAGTFFFLPHTIFVAEHGLPHFDLSLAAQYELTQRFSCEFSIRAYIASDPERTFAQLQRWAADPKPHVRRLVSEGTRLRLPWGTRVAWLDANPTRVLQLLELLKHDPATVVRRSIANNLNDLSKVYPDLVIQTCRSWLQDANVETQALVRHALRSLVKHGHRGALALLGAGKRPKVKLTAARLSAKSLQLGGKLSFSFTLESTARASQQLVVDYAVHFVKARGLARPKVFKLKRVTLAPRGTAQFRGNVSFARMTTRQHYPGTHLIEILVNGQAFPLGQLAVRS